MPILKPVICESDAEKLSELIDQSWVQLIADEYVLLLLQERLKIALIVPDEIVSTTIVRMQSMVSLQFVDSPHLENMQLVFPKDANILSARLSVLSPIGISILGQEAGEVTTAQLASGPRQLTIVDVVHPQLFSSFNS